MSMTPSPPPPPPSGPAPAPGSAAPTGGSLLSSSWQALRHDKELIALPVIGGLFALVAALPVVIVGVFVPEEASWITAVVALIAALVVAVVSTFFAVALAAGAHERMSGGSPTIASSMAVAWSRKRGVIGWALLSVVVGTVLSIIRDKVKVAGPILALIGDVAWSVASFFTIPIIAANDIGPIDALKLSAKTFKDRWSSAVRVEFRLALYVIGLVVALVLGLVLAGLAAQVATVLGVIVAVVVIGAFLVAMLVFGALRSYARVALYRYASGLPTPGFSTTVLANSVR